MELSESIHVPASLLEQLKARHAEKWAALPAELRDTMVAEVRAHLPAGTADAMRADNKCEVLSGCDKPASLRYRAMGGGHMHLCLDHGAKHAPYCERWTHRGWVEAVGLQRELAARRKEYDRGYQAGYHARQRAKEDSE